VTANPAAASAPPPKPKRRRRIGWIITVTLLSLAVLGVGALLVLTYLRLQEALTVIEQQNDLIDEKQTFSAAMTDLVAKTTEFDGIKVGALVPQDRLDLLAARGWLNRRDADAMSGVTSDVRAEIASLDGLLTTAAQQAAENSSDTTYEATIDALGGGFVVTAIDNADKLCHDDVLGCVAGDDPYTVHIDKADTKLPYMTSFIRKGLSFHEFAHVLQYTNPVASDEAVKSFKGDYEKMADCFALAYLKGWKLHHTVWVSDFEYYEVDVGYGYTCNSKQKALIREWYEGLGYASQPITQD